MNGECKGIMFASTQMIECLEKHGYCVSVVSKKNSKANHPKIGDCVHLLLDDNSSTSRRVVVRLVADQKRSDGGLISIYMPFPVVFDPQKHRK